MTNDLGDVRAAGMEGDRPQDVGGGAPAGSGPAVDAPLP